MPPLSFPNRWPIVPDPLRAIPYAMIAGMPIQRARNGEVLKDVLITQNVPDWEAFKAVAVHKRTSRSALIRRYVRWEVKRHRRQVSSGTV